MELGHIFSVRPSEFEIENVGVILAGQAYAESHDGLLPRTLFWKRMEFRHDLNPARFDHFHANIGFLIEHETNHVSCSEGPKDWTGCTQTPVDPPCLNPQAVPEPASIVTLSISAFAWVVAVLVLGKRDSRK